MDITTQDQQCSFSIFSFSLINNLTVPLHKNHVEIRSPTCILHRKRRHTRATDQASNTTYANIRQIQLLNFKSLNSHAFAMSLLNIQIILQLPFFNYKLIVFSLQFWLHLHTALQDMNLKLGMKLMFVNNFCSCLPSIYWIIL
jgi:hypothetical protein